MITHLIDKKVNITTVNPDACIKGTLLGAVGNFFEVKIFDERTMYVAQDKIVTIIESPNEEARK